MQGNTGGGSVVLDDGGMSARILPVSALTESEIARWRELSSRAVEPSPFADPDFVLPGVPLRPDAAALRLLVVQRADRWVLALAFVVVPSTSSVRMRTLSNRAPFLEDESLHLPPLVDADEAVEAFRGLFQAMRRLRLPGLLKLDRIQGDGPLVAALESAARAESVPMLHEWSDPHAYLRSTRQLRALDVDGVSFDLPHLSGHRRRVIRQQARKLESEHGPLTVEDRSDDPAAVQEFLDLQERGWKGDESRGGRALRTLGRADWFVAVTDSLRAAGRLHVTQLSAGGRVVYMCIDFRAGDRLFGGADVYDERFARQGGGTVGRVATLVAKSRDPRIESFDPNMPSEYVDSGRLFPDTRDQIDVLLAPGAAATRVLVRALPRLRAMRRRLPSRRREPASADTSVARTASVRELTAADISRWEQLFERSANAYPYLDPAYLTVTAKHDPAVDVRLLIVEDDERWLLLMPFVVRRLRLDGVPARVLSNRDPFLRERSSWMHPVVGAEHAERAFTALLRCTRRLRLPGLVELESFPGEGPLFDGIHAAAQAQGIPVQIRWRGEHVYVPALSRPGGRSAEPQPADTDLEHVGKERRRGNRQRHARLERDAGAPLTVVDRSDDPAAVEDFLELQSRGWKGDVASGGAAYRAVGEDAWFRALVARFRAAGRAHVYQLSAGDPLYISVNFRSGTRLFGISDAYDERYARHSPGTLGRIATVYTLAAQDPRIESYDPHMAAGYEEASRLYPDVEPEVSLLVGAGRIARLTLLAGRARNRIRATIRDGRR